MVRYCCEMRESVLKTQQLQGLNSHCGAIIRLLAITDATVIYEASCFEECDGLHASGLM